tara:strand:- start:672 stop:1121 length:450 start_codon:yes stop_codon:yes gene_type:complete
MKILNFKPDKSIHVNNAEIIQNQLIYIDNSQGHFLDQTQIGYLKVPVFFGLLNKKMFTAATVNSNEVNLINPITLNQNHFITDEAVFDLQEEIEDKIIDNVLAESEHKPNKPQLYERYIGVAIIIGAVTVALLAMVVMIPYLISKFGAI